MSVRRALGAVCVVMVLVGCDGAEITSPNASGEDFAVGPTVASSVQQPTSGSDSVYWVNDVIEFVDPDTGDTLKVTRSGPTDAWDTYKFYRNGTLGSTFILDRTAETWVHQSPNGGWAEWDDPTMEIMTTSYDEEYAQWEDDFCGSEEGELTLDGGRTGDGEDPCA